jgi:hypothetical protein
MSIIEEQINNAYNALSATKLIASEKYLTAIDYKAVLEAEVAHFIVGGEVVGKNAEERKAYIENKFAPGYAELRAKERLAELTKVQVELAQIEVKRIESILRLMEVLHE